MEEIHKMSIFEIISAIVLVIACAFIVVVILLKDTKTQMSQTISGTSSDSFYQKNAGRTKEAMLNKATIAAAIIFFVLAVAVNLINVYGKKAKADDTSSNSAAVVTSSEEESSAADGESGASDAAQIGAESKSDESSTASGTSESSTASETSESSETSTPESETASSSAAE